MTAEPFALTHPGLDARSREADHAPSARTWDLLHGRWQDCLDVECDMWCSDAPFSARTHAGHDATSGIGARGDLGYEFLTPEQVCETVDFWEPRTRQWFTTITDHTLFPVWAGRLESLGRYVFAPIPVIDIGMTVRLHGDGPSCWTAWLIVARPRTAKGRKWRMTRAICSTDASTAAAAAMLVGTASSLVYKARSLMRHARHRDDLVAVEPFQCRASEIEAKLDELVADIEVHVLGASS